MNHRDTPFPRTYTKHCVEHKEIATYCTMEKRWICPSCPMDKKLKATGFLQVTKMVRRWG